MGAEQRRMTALESSSSLLLPRRSRPGKTRPCSLPAVEVLGLPTANTSPCLGQLHHDLCHDVHREEEELRVKPCSLESEGKVISSVNFGRFPTKPASDHTDTSLPFA